MSAIAHARPLDPGAVTDQRPISFFGWSLALGGGLGIWWAVIALIV